MASFGFKFEVHDGRKDKLGLHKLRSLFMGSSVSNAQNISIEHKHLLSGHKQGVSKSYSYNQVSAAQDDGLSRNKPVLSFSSSVTDRQSFKPSENNQPDFYKKSSVHATSRHPALSFSKSLPGHAYKNQGDHSVGESKATQTGGKLRLSRAGRDTFALHDDDKLRRSAQVWRNDHDQAKKRKEGMNFNNQSFRNEVSLTSRLSKPEDHIYEEIDSDLFTSCDEEEHEVEENFLLGISLERRNNLKFYGSAGWDFGN